MNNLIVIACSLLNLDPLQLITPSEVISRVLSQFFQLPINGNYLIHPSALLITDRTLFNLIDNYFNNEIEDNEEETSEEELEDTAKLGTFYSIVIPDLFLISFPISIPQINTLIKAVYEAIKIN